MDFQNILNLANVIQNLVPVTVKIFTKIGIDTKSGTIRQSAFHTFWQPSGIRKQLLL